MPRRRLVCAWGANGHAVAAVAKSAMKSRRLNASLTAQTEAIAASKKSVVVEYPTLEKATAAYNSAAYAEALRALGDGAVRDFRIVEAVEQQ
jgi:uncharacterized protein (DUF1330 family)